MRVRPTSKARAVLAREVVFREAAEVL